MLLSFAYRCAVRLLPCQQSWQCRKMTCTWRHAIEDTIFILKSLLVWPCLSATAGVPIGAGSMPPFVLLQLVTRRAIHHGPKPCVKPNIHHHHRHTITSVTILKSHPLTSSCPCSRPSSSPCLGTLYSYSSAVFSAVDSPSRSCWPDPL